MIRWKGKKIDATRNLFGDIVAGGTILAVRRLVG
jgi:hypothetical protein